MRFRNVFLSITGLWLVSAVTFGHSAAAPELPLIARAKDTPEYPVLKRIQESTLELQLLEITLKNRRDAELESKMTAAIKEIEDNGIALGTKFKATRAIQLEGVLALLESARRYGLVAGVAQPEWTDLFAALQGGQINAGTLYVHTPKGAPLALLTLMPLSMGKQTIWHVGLPPFDRASYWVHARSKARAMGVEQSLSGRAPRGLGNATLEKRVRALNQPFDAAELLVKGYYRDAYTKLYAAFETQRYAILQRVQIARKALLELSKSNSAMGSPEQYAALYNQVLESLFSYGVDISLSNGLTGPRDFEINGFLFAESPEAARGLVTKLKFTPSQSGANYNSPSS